MEGFSLRKEDVIESFVRSSGPGGQNVNKVATAVMLIHQPSGLVIKCQEFRSQFQNRAKAWDLLKEALQEKEQQRLQRRIALKEKERRQRRRRTLLGKEKMLADKKRKAIKKLNRQKARDDD